VHDDVPEPLKLADLIQDNWIPSSSALWRRAALPRFPDWFSRSMFEDWPLFLLLAMKGAIHYIPETMSVYRQHDGGLWSSLEPAEQFRKTGDFLLFLERHVPGLPSRQLRDRAAYWRCRSAECDVKAGRRREAVKALVEGLWMSRLRLVGTQSFRDAWRAVKEPR